MASTLVVEDGSGTPGADAYAELATILAYWEARGDATLSALTTDSLRDAAVRRATQFLDLQWGDRFKGDAQYEAQALSWPRLYVYTREGWALTGVPAAVVTATAELSRLAVAGPLGGSGAAAQAPGQADIESMKAGSVDIKYRTGFKSEIEQSHADRFFLVERLLRPLLRGAGINQGSSR